MRQFTRIFTPSIFSLLLCCCLTSCEEPVVEQPAVVEDITEEKPRLKSMISTAFLTEHFGPDSATFEEQVNVTYDTAGKVIDRKQYILDSTILYKHKYYVQEGDTLVEVVKDINNVYRPRVEYDTIKYLNDLMVESTFIRSYRFRSTPSGREEEYPIPTKVFYTYDDAGVLITTRTLHDGKERGCIYTYDSTNTLIAQTCSEKDSNETFYEKQDTHDNKGLKTRQSETFYEDGDEQISNQYIQEYFYNDKGLKVRQTETSYVGDSISGQYVRHYRYNDIDSLAYQSWYRNGKNFAIYYYEYDELGRKLAELIYNDGNGDSTQLAMQTHYYYNTKDQLALISILGHKNEPMRTTYFFYDAEGYKVEERRYTNTIDVDRQKYMTRLVTKYQYAFYE